MPAPFDVRSRFVKDVSGLVKSPGFWELWNRAGPQMCGVFPSDWGSKVAVLLNAPSEMSVSGEDIHWHSDILQQSPCTDIIYSCNLDQSNSHTNFSEDRLLFYFLKHFLSSLQYIWFFRLQLSKVYFKINWFWCNIYCTLAFSRTYENRFHYSWQCLMGFISTPKALCIMCRYFQPSLLSTVSPYQQAYTSLGWQGDKVKCFKLSEATVDASLNPKCWYYRSGLIFIEINRIFPFCISGHFGWIKNWSYLVMITTSGVKI